MTRAEDSLGMDPDAPLCPSGKRPHRDQETAERALAAVRAARASGDRNGRTRHREADRVEDGPCSACGWWHIASNGKDPRRRRDRRGEHRHRAARRRR